MKNKTSFKRIFELFAIAFALFFFAIGPFLFVTPKAEALIPFGGRVLTMITCVNGILVTVGPPRGGSFMWAPGTRSYLNGPPSHPGQWLLGNAATPLVCFVPCSVGLCPAGVGLFITMHGSSL